MPIWYWGAGVCSSDLCVVRGHCAFDKDVPGPLYAQPLNIFNGRARIQSLAQDMRVGEAPASEVTGFKLSHALRHRESLTWTCTQLHKNGRGVLAKAVANFSVDLSWNGSDNRQEQNWRFTSQRTISQHPHKHATILRFARKSYVEGKRM